MGDIHEQVAASQTHHLQEGQVPSSHVVKVDFHLSPIQLTGHVEGLTVTLVVHEGVIQGQLSQGLVDASSKLARKEIHTHDAEDKPEDQANEEDIHDGWDGTYEGIDHDLGETEKGD